MIAVVFGILERLGCRVPTIFFVCCVREVHEEHAGLAAAATVRSCVDRRRARVSASVADCRLRLVKDRESGLPNETNAMFTNVEGDWDEVMAPWSDRRASTPSASASASAAVERGDQDQPSVPGSPTELSLRKVVPPSRTASPVRPRSSFWLPFANDRCRAAARTRKRRTGRLLVSPVTLLAPAGLDDMRRRPLPSLSALFGHAEGLRLRLRELGVDARALLIAVRPRGASSSAVLGGGPDERLDVRTLTRPPSRPARSSCALASSDPAAGDEVHEHAEVRDDDHEEHPDRLGEATEVVAAEDVLTSSMRSRIQMKKRKKYSIDRKTCPVPNSASGTRAPCRAQDHAVAESRVGPAARCAS